MNAMIPYTPLLPLRAAGEALAPPPPQENIYAANAALATAREFQSAAPWIGAGTGLVLGLLLWAKLK